MLRRLLLCANDAGGDGDKGGGGGGGGTPPTSIKVGEQTYTVEQIQALADKAASADQVNSFAQQMGMDVDTLLKNSENAFSIVVDLQKQGILQADGSIKMPEAKPLTTPPGGTPPVKDPAAEALSKINTTLEAIGRRVETIETGQAQLYENEINQVIQKQYPNLDGEDLNWIKREALKRNKPVLTVAEERNKFREGSMEKMEAALMQKLAKKYGLDFEALNNVPNFGPDGPTPTAFIPPGKKLSMKGEGDTVKVGDVVRNFFEAKGRS